MQWVLLPRDGTGCGRERSARRTSPAYQPGVPARRTSPAYQLPGRLTEALRLVDKLAR